MPPRTRTAQPTRTVQPSPSMSLAHLANDLRLACMRISRRVRFESMQAVAPHQYSVMARLDKTALTPRELADIERVSPPSMTRRQRDAWMASRLKGITADEREVLT